MSTEYTDRSRIAASRTRDAASLAVRRRDSQAVFTMVTLLYLAAYLWALGHLSPGLGGTGVHVVADPLGKFLQPALGPFSFTPIARITLGPVTYLFSFNTVLGLGVAGLVGLNLALTYLAWIQPEACGISESSTGVLVSLPALLSGTACCGPVALIVLGIQASGILVTAFQFLLPLAIVLLVGSLVLIGRQIDPEAMSARSSG